MLHHRSIVHLVAIGMALAAPAARGQDISARRPAEDVGGQDVRRRQGLLPGENLLFNGWGVTPAGEQVRTGDMPLKMVVAPDRKRLVAVGGGFGDHGLTLIDMAGRRVSQFLPMAEAWNGLAFSGDGRRIFVSAGDRAEVHVFTYADGTAAPDRAVRPDPQARGAFLAGIAVHPTTGVVYVCDEAHHEVWALDGQTLALRARVAVGPHPHSCAMGADRRHLYVSNWGGRSVSIVDTAADRRVRDVTVGLRPNDMALAPDGRLFVACAGDNTVHVLQTRGLEKPADPASPARRLWEATREVISTSLYPQSPEGSTPDAVAVSPDGKTLFVANADNNDVMVVDISGATLDDEARRYAESISVVNGFIPVGWYPTALAVSPDGGTLFVANGKGLRSHPNVPPRGADGPRSGEASPVRPRRQDARRLGLVHRAARRRAAGIVHAAGAAELAVHARVAPPRADRGRRRDPGRGGPALPDQVRPVHHQGEPHLRPGARRHEGRRRQANRQRRPEPDALRRGRDAEPAPARARLRPARQPVLQRRGERRRA